MIIESIEVQNFLSHEHSKVDFTPSPLTLVCGDNGSGKSSLFDAAEYVLYGKHRGGTHDSCFLVKDGAQRAMVRLVLNIEESRYRITRHIDAKSGNFPAIVELWNPESGNWEQQNVGDHVHDAWTWLAKRLPEYDLFCSAIYLRQGETAHVLSGHAKRRLERFAALVDLSAYTTAAERSKEYRDRSRQRQHDAEVRLEALGDLSQEVLDARTLCVQDAVQEHEQTKELVACKVAVATGAHEWSRLSKEQETLSQQRDQTKELIARADEIRAAAMRVQRWERTQPKLDRYWDAHRRSVSSQNEALTHRAAEEEHKRVHEDQSKELAQLSARVQEINQSELPGTQSRVEAQRAELSDLTCEVEIARALVSQHNANRQAAEFGDPDTEIEHWMMRQQAIPLLRQVVTACDEESRSTRDIADEQEAVNDAQNLVTSATEDIVRAATEESQCQRSADDAMRTARKLSEDLARISGSIQSHERLKGNEGECPVCARTLDVAAHTHVRVVLATERQQMEQLLDATTAASMKETDTKKKLAEAQRQTQQTNAKLQEANSRHARALERLDQAQKILESARARRERLLSEVACLHPPYAEELATPATEDVESEVQVVKKGLGEAKKRKNARETVLQAVVQAQAEANTLRARRRPGMIPLGETLTVDELTNRTSAGQKDLAEWQRLLEVVEREAKDIQLKLRTLTAELASRAAKRDAAQEAAQRAEIAAESATQESQRVATQIEVEWQSLLVDEEAISRENNAIEIIRPLAEQLADLEQSHGRLQHLEGELATVQTRLNEVSPEVRISVDEADAAVVAARDAESDANVRRVQADTELADLLQRRVKSAQWQAEIDTECSLAVTYDELFDLLKEGGAIQVELAEYEQRQICEEVNGVLGLLNDPLQVTLGEARRTRGIELQDVLIIDTSDPYGRPRYFEFLSGGEKFRIAMALALALHRRVGRGVAGTLIVDEGFGALDGNHRDKLAQQMTNISHGILHLELARSIIICSHSVEVQRHFPYRWLITKRDGTATASLTDLTGDGANDLALSEDIYLGE